MSRRPGDFKRIVPFGLFVLLLLLSAAQMSCGPKYQVKWQAYSPEALSESLASGKPAILYFTAAWCGPCYMLKEKTFSDLNVIQAMEPLTRLKADMSFRESPRVIALGERYQVEGLPTFILFKPGGNPAGDLRFSGFMPPDVLIEALESFLQEA